MLRKNLKFVISICLAAVLTLSSSFAAFALDSLSAPDLPIKGDADKDGKITMSDVTLMQRFMASFEDAQLCKDCCNVYKYSDESPDFDMVDVTCIQKYLAFIIDINSMCGMRQGCKCRLSSDCFNGLSEEQTASVKKAYREFAKDSRHSDEELTVEHYGTMSDGSILVRCSSSDMMYAQAVIRKIIGNYLYEAPHSGKIVYLYKDGAYMPIDEAYGNKLIDDKVLGEIAQALGFYDAEYHLYNYFNEKGIHMQYVSSQIVGTFKNGSVLVRAAISDPSVEKSDVSHNIGDKTFTHPANEVYLTISLGGTYAQELGDNIPAGEYADELAELLSLAGVDWSNPVKP